MAKKDNQNKKPNNQPALENIKPPIDGRVVNQYFERKNPTPIPPKMELKPPKK